MLLTPQSAQTPTDISGFRRQLRIISILIACVTLVVFWNSLSNSFVLDDEPLILKNRFLTSITFLPQLLTRSITAGSGDVGNTYRPLQMLTHFFDVTLWDYHPWGHHLSSVLLHVVLAVTVFRLLATRFPLWPAAIGAALFALHPLQSEVVAGISGRADTLSMLFLFLGLLAIQHRPFLSLLCAALSMASKESGVLFPLFLWLYDRTADQPQPLRRHYPFWLLAELYVIARLTVLNFRNTVNFYEWSDPFTEHFSYRLFTYFTTLAKGIQLWLWPVDIHHLRAWPMFRSPGEPQVLLSLLFIVLLVFLAIRSRKRAPLIAMGIVWFLVATLPTSNLVAIIYARLYDHWFLLPGFGLIIVGTTWLSSIWSGSPRHRRAATAVSVAAVIAVSVLTIRHNAVWHDPETLYRHILFWEPRSEKTYHNLALLYDQQGRTEEAIALYQQALTIREDLTKTHHHLALAYLKLGDETAAYREFLRTVQIDRLAYHSWLEIGHIELRRGHADAACEAFQHAIESYPFSPYGYLSLAQIYVADGHPHRALALIDAALTVLPGDHELQSVRQDLAATPASSGNNAHHEPDHSR